MPEKLKKSTFTQTAIVISSACFMSEVATD